MKKIFMFLLCLCAYMIPSTYAQVTTSINYAGAPLNTQSCNVFNAATSPVVGGLTHYPVSGGVSYDGTNIILITAWNNSSSLRLGTAFAIAYPFKKGHSYTITLTAASTTPAMARAQTMHVNFYTTLPDPNQTGAAGCGGISAIYYSAVESANTFETQGGGDIKVYSFAPYTPATDMNVVTILATPTIDSGSPGSAQLRISKVSITDNVVLNMITPNLVTKVCGTALSQNVGVSIPVVDGITGYRFNLGNNNGWFYNGSPAPATIITPSSAITLTAPACGTTPITSVSASIDVAGRNYAALGVVPVANVLPNVSIAGATSAICTNATFSVDAPCGSTVNWSASNLPGIASITPSGSSVVVTRIGSGQITLTATVSGGCYSTPVTVIKTLNVGVLPSPVLSNISLVPYPYYGVSAYANTTISGPFYWYVDGVLKKTTSTGFSDAIPVGSCGVQHRLQVVIKNSCGEGWSDPFYWTNNCGTRVANPNLTTQPDSLLRSQLESESDKTMDVVIAPNPSSNNVIVTINPAKTNLTPSFVKAIRIMDMSGKTQKTLNYPNSSQTKVTVDVSEFKPGIYLINVSDGRNNYIKKLVIQ